MLVRIAVDNSNRNPYSVFMADDIKQGREADGKYAKKTPCDGCGKPCTGTHYTDDEVCNGSDGPGFFLCDRVRCPANDWQDLPPDERRKRYTAQRARNQVR